MDSSDFVKAAVKKGILDEDHHHPLIRRIDFFSKQCRVPVPFICMEAKRFMTTNQREAIKNWRETQDDGCKGFFFHGSPDKSITEVFLTAAGWMIRNSIDARIYTANEIVLSMQEDDLPDCTVLFIPDLVIGNKAVVEWVGRLITGALIQRATADLFTIVYADNQHHPETVYGQTLAKHIHNLYQKVML